MKSLTCFYFEPPSRVVPATFIFLWWSPQVPLKNDTHVTLGQFFIDLYVYRPNYLPNSTSPNLFIIKGPMQVSKVHTRKGTFTHCD